MGSRGWEGRELRTQLRGKRAKSRSRELRQLLQEEMKTTPQENLEIGRECGRNNRNNRFLAQLLQPP